MQFTKYTGLGNDFVLLDGAAAADLKNPSALAKTICNRRFGVGADGLVLLLPSAKADVTMRIFTATAARPKCAAMLRAVWLCTFSVGKR